MRDYDMERFLMHYGVPGMKRPKGLRYKTRGSTSLYANRQRQMHGEDNGDDSESTGNKFLDIRNKQEKQAKEAKKTKEQIEKYRKDKAEDERSSKLMYTRETPHRARYQEEVNSRKLGKAKNTVNEIADKNNSSMAKLRKKKETAKESVRTAKQIEKYRKDKAEDEKWAKVRQEAKQKEENKRKFLNIPKNIGKQVEVAKKQKRVKEQQSKNEFNKSVLDLIDRNRPERKGGKLQNPNKRVIESNLPKFPDVTVKRKKKKKKTSGESRRSWQD